MAFQLDKRVLPQLPEGNYRATMLTWEDSSDQRGDRLTLQFQFPDRVQKLVIFPTNIDFWTAGLSRQLNITTPLTQMEVLELAEGKEFDLAVTHWNGYLNLSPYVQNEPSTALTADQALAEDSLVTTF